MKSIAPTLVRIRRFVQQLPWKRYVKRTMAAFLSLAVIFVLLVLSLRWMNPSFTAFTLQEDWEALGIERYSLKDHWVPYEELPENIKWAVVASEDQRFWDHHGLDLYAIGKAIQEKRKGGRIRGASTISQQVAKNLFLWPGRSYFRKGLEAGITLTMEVLWPKERILEVYLNIAEFGPGIYGIGKASDHFFAKEASELEAGEAARMAAVLPSPKRMRVEPPTPYVKERKDWILRNMMNLSGIAYYKEAEKYNGIPVDSIDVFKDPVLPLIRVRSFRISDIIKADSANGDSLVQGAELSSRM